MQSYKLNTSNEDKFKEFKRLFAQHGCLLESSHIDLREVDADPFTVVACKASQVGERVLVEDTSLEIEGASVGIHVRWLLDHLTDYIGKKAQWTVLLAYHADEQVFICQGRVSGKIVEPKGKEGFGFDPVFLPDGTDQTLAQSKPDSVNARAKAVEALLNGEVEAIFPLMEEWDGPWQQSES